MPDNGDMTPAIAKSFLNLHFDRSTMKEIEALLRKNNRGTISTEERIAPGQVSSGGSVSRSDASQGGTVASAKTEGRLKKSCTNGDQPMLKQQLADELASFRDFVAEKAKAGESAISPEEALDEWRAMNPDAEDLEQSAAIVRQALEDMRNGDHGRDADEVLDELRKRYNLPSV
jgi:hypothetical protein